MLTMWAVVVVLGISLCAGREFGEGQHSRQSRGVLEDRYKQALSKSILFYEAQRSGNLPGNNRISWRRNSCTNDGSPVNKDLSGGWYDAGDYVKFNFPMASAVTFLAWGMIDFKQGYQWAGQYGNAKDEIKWALDYLLKCHPDVNVDEFYVQVGNGEQDHRYYGRPEQLSASRPVYKIDRNRKGSDVAGETAAAMAAGYIIFKDTDRAYANNLLRHARKHYSFAKNYKGKYSDGRNEFSFYSSSGYLDELVWAAAWLYKATGETSFRSYAESKITELGDWASWAFSWDDKKVGAQLLLFQLTRKNKYKNMVTAFLNSWKPGSGMHYLSQGLAYRSDWGPNRYAANSAAIAILAYKSGINVTMGSGTNLKWGCGQIDILLGKTATGGKSYVVGYGTNYPKKPHHRASACPTNRNQACNKATFENEGQNNPSILTGALVGGPGWDGRYEDRRGNYKQSEVAVDYNAGFQTALAGCRYYSSSL